MSKIRRAAGQHRGRHICVRVSEREWRRIAAHAKRTGESVGAVARARTLDLIAAAGRLPVPATRTGAEERRELRGIGVLLASIEAYTAGDRDAASEASLGESQRWIVSRVRRR